MLSKWSEFLFLPSGITIPLCTSATSEIVSLLHFVLKKAIISDKIEGFVSSEKDFWVSMALKAFVSI